MTTESPWIEDKAADVPTWNRKFGTYHTYGYVVKMGADLGYNWQAVRGDIENRLSGLEPTSESAMAAADAALAAPFEDFAARLVQELAEKISKIEARILALSPTATILPGYHAGYEAGFAEAKRRIDEVLA